MGRALHRGGERVLRAALLAAGQSAGQHFEFALHERTIVGVVGEIKVRGLERTSEPQVYLGVRARTTLLCGMPLYYAFLKAESPNVRAAGASPFSWKGWFLMYRQRTEF
jgi:hypothetical protein